MTDKSEQVLAVTALRQWFCQRSELIGSDITIGVGNFFRAGDLQTLSFFQYADEVGSIQQRLHGTGIQPGSTTTEKFNLQLSVLHIGFVDVSDFQLTTR